MHKIARAAALLKLPFSEREFEAWENIRHARAHGDFSISVQNHDKFQSEWADRDCVANLINKFVLALIGYSGPYTDYSSPGYPIKQLFGNAPSVLQ
jgi:hypothetical protein